MWTCLYYVLLFKRASCLSTQCLIMVKDYVIMLNAVVSWWINMWSYSTAWCCSRKFTHATLCGQNDTWVWHNNISSRQVTFRQDCPNFNIMTYTFDIIKHRVDKSTPYVDKITCLCKIITHYIDKFAWFLDKITPRCDKVKLFFNITRQCVGACQLYILTKQRESLR